MTDRKKTQSLPHAQLLAEQNCYLSIAKVVWDVVIVSSLVDNSRDIITPTKFYYYQSNDHDP